MSGIPPIDEMFSEEDLAGMSEESRAVFQQVIDGQRERKRLIAESANAGDFDKALMFCDSQERGPILARAGEVLEGDELRKVVAGWWSATEAWGGDPELRDGVMNALHKAALDGPVIVPQDEPGWPPAASDGAFEVFRGNLGEKPQGGSWSLSRETAEFFARMAGGVRGQLVLGMSGPGPASIWRGWVHEEDVLGFFNDRGEKEIVTDHVYGIEKIGEMVPAEEAS